VNFKSTFWLTLAVLHLGIAGNALAATVYTYRTEFEAALLSSTIENFENEDPFGEPNASPLAPDGLTNYELEDFSLEATPKAIKILDILHSGSHNTTAGGENFLYLDTDNPVTDNPDTVITGSTTDFSLYNPVDAFGFDYTGVFEPDTAFTVTIGSNVFNLALNNTEPSPLFWGVLGLGSFTDITLTTSLDSGYGVDDVTFGSAIPLPPAIWLFGSGLMALAGGAVNRKTRS
jgi:hypothetical protein